MPSLTALSAIVVSTPLLAGCLLLLSWLQHPRQAALAIWGSGFLTASAAAALIVVARGVIPEFWSVIVGNALFAAMYGIFWSGARKFEGRAVSISLASLGILAWLLASSIGPVYARPEFRAAVMAVIGICYTLLAVRELWLGRDDGTWRWPIMTLLLVHAAMIPLRVPIAGAWKHPDVTNVDLLTFTIFEAAFVSICCAYLFCSLVKDRIAAGFRRASVVDALTGVANRRGFFERGDRLLARARFDNQPIALITFDLDRFKGINDRYGHSAGDDILIAFCRLAEAQMRPNDLFARIGGEEFAALVPNTSLRDALRLAERLRVAFEATSHTIEQSTIRTTVSAGVALLSGAAPDLAALLSAGDQALYRAKQAGRNRVEVSSPILECDPDSRSKENHLSSRSAA
jgi:diguanylate cyclase (GGDEF)-like protein